MQILKKNLSDNKSANPNFIRSSQESSSTNSLVINTNNATKRKSDESSKIEQIGADQTLNVENEEIDDDAHNPQASPYHNNKTLMKPKKKKQDLVIKVFITSHNKDQ